MDTWDNFQKYFFRDEKIGLSIDFSKVGLSDEFFSKMSEKISRAYREMGALEAGAIANQDENRMVGHYWLRNPDICPTEDIQRAINSEITRVLKFAESVHLGHVAGQSGRFENALFIGIGGSALGPQLIYDSLRGNDKLRCFFIDNTDPDGLDLILQDIGENLGKTLVVVTSKSGSTPEPRNSMIEVKASYEKSGYLFSRHAVAISGENSLLDKQAAMENWIIRFPMWDWVGGRTSMFSSVGLLPMALKGGSVKDFISGARDMDSVTRLADFKNPAMMMALSWYLATEGVGKKDMVFIPYKDRLINFSSYLQQLIMESIGKEKDRDGKIVRQGLTVYGNKGSTDQHSFVQQLRDGLKNFFITVLTVLKAREGDSIVVDDRSMTSGDYLNGFALGTMKALSDNHVPVIHIAVEEFSEYKLGLLIALYERAVGFYASMINVNAYHQPGVEAGKKAAEEVLKIQKRIMEFLTNNKNSEISLEKIIESINGEDENILIFKILEFLSANEKLKKIDSDDLMKIRYQLI